MPWWLKWTQYLLLGFLGVAVAGPSEAAKPNVVLIVCDDAGYADFSMQGARDFPTPHIDSIAANGVRFTNAYVSASVCSPARAGMMTGRYQQRFGHEHNIPPFDSETNGLPLSEKTLADGMKGLGYRTIAIGKWHLGYDPKFNPLERGFDDFYGFLAGARDYLPNEAFTVRDRMMEGKELVAREKFAFLTDELGNRAAAAIRQHKDRPFFLYLAFNAPHTPQRVRGDDWKRAEQGGGRRKRLIAMTMALDRAVGMVLDELKKHGLFDDTLVLFINDNGGPSMNDNVNDDADNSPLRGFKGSLWEGGIRVPLALQWPAALPKGKRYDAPVIALDIMPTAMAAAGSNTPPGQPWDGVNLLPFLKGEITDAPHKALCWRAGTDRAVRMGDWKLIASGGRPQLFNLADDVHEDHDQSAKRPDMVRKLEAAYVQWNSANIAPQWSHRRPTDASPVLALERFSVSKPQESP